MFYNHFIATLYHFLGLTYCHSAQCQLLFFCLFFTSWNMHIKWSPNATKLFGDFFRLEDNLGAKEAAEGRPMGPNTHLGAPGPLECPGVLWAPRASPLVLPWHPSKISKKFCGIWTSFGTDILRSKKQAKKYQLALCTMSIG